MSRDNSNNLPSYRDFMENPDDLPSIEEFKEENLPSVEDFLEKTVEEETLTLFRLQNGQNWSVWLMM